MGKAQTTYDLDDLQSDIGRLSHLLNAINDLAIEGPALVETDSRGAHLPGLERLGSLAWIARDLTAGIDRRVADNFRAIGSRFAATEASAPAATPDRTVDLAAKMRPWDLYEAIATCVAARHIFDLHTAGEGDCDSAPYEWAEAQRDAIDSMINDLARELVGRTGLSEDDEDTRDMALRRAYGFILVDAAQPTEKAVAP